MSFKLIYVQGVKGYTITAVRPFTPVSMIFLILWIAR